MVFKAKDFTETERGILERLSITYDGKKQNDTARKKAEEDGEPFSEDLEGKLRIVPQDKTLGGRWLSREENERVRDAIKGYAALPEAIMPQGTYSPLEYLQIAAAAGQFTVPDLSQEYGAKQRDLEGQLEVVNFRASGDGRPPQRVRDRYWDFNEKQKTEGNAPVYPDQFAGMLIDAVGRDVMRLETAAQELIGGVKKDLNVSPQDAMLNAVEASYMLAVVNAVKPQLNAVRDKYEQRQQARAQ